MPILQPKKSTAELIVEPQTLHLQQTNALAAKQVKHDQLVANAQVVAKEIKCIARQLLIWMQSCTLCFPRCCSVHPLLHNQRLLMLKCLRERLLMLRGVPALPVYTLAFTLSGLRRCACRWRPISSAYFGELLGDKSKMAQQYLLRCVASVSPLGRRVHPVSVDGPSLEVIASFARCGTNVGEMQISGFGTRQEEVQTLVACRGTDIGRMLDHRSMSRQAN